MFRGNEKTRKRKTVFLKAYKNSMCNVSDACKAVRINRSTFYREWTGKDEVFAERVKEAEESLYDFVQSQMLKKIKEGDVTMLIYYSKCKMKDRGFIEKVENQLDGINIVIERMIIPDKRPLQIISKKGITHEEKT